MNRIRIINAVLTEIEETWNFPKSVPLQITIINIVTYIKFVLILSVLMELTVNHLLTYRYFGTEIILAPCYI